MGGPVDATMPALLSGGDSSVFTPVAQLGAGPDGVVVLGTRGDKLVEVHHLMFGPSSPRWAALAQRARAIGAVAHPAIRPVLGMEEEPPQLLLEGDSFPALAELLEQPGVELSRALRVILEIGRAVHAAHHVGLVHGGLHPWSVWVGPADRPRLELSGLATRSVSHGWAERCRAPEVCDGAVPDAAADVYALGVMLQLFVEQQGLDARSLAHLRGAMHIDPDARMTLGELLRGLHAAVAEVADRVTLDEDQLAVRALRPAMGVVVGRFELVKQLGVGAMGEVWEARDRTSELRVAIKLLRREVAGDAELLRRFRKEARVLARVGSPHIANIIDLNEDGGLHYLVLELVPGGSVGGALRRLGKLPEKLALAVVADVCRALAEPHRLGIVHRDLKPDNMMFVREGIELEPDPAGQIVKLGDFGIARAAPHSDSTEVGQMTREGAVLGTPEYMAPEQCEGDHVTPATDVYALGCCLFALIAGHPPFASSDQPMQILLKHIHEPPPALESIVPEVSPEVAALVATCLKKDPRQRPADAAEVLAEIERMTTGVVALITAHPAPPIHRASRIVTYTFEWELKSSPDALWPFVSNTEKMNRATGLAPVRFEIEAMKSGAPSSSPGTTAHQRVAGLQLNYREHPYEWIEGSRHVVLRVFDGGLLRWYVAEVQLERLAGGGTRLRNTIRLEPRSWFARLISKYELGFKYRRNLDRVYRQIDRVVAAGPSPSVDPIEPDVVLPARAQVVLQQTTDKLVAADVPRPAVEALVTYLAQASDQDCARIRPLEIAARFGVNEEAMIDAALHAASIGTLGMVWDVICPSCRIPSSIVESLEKIEEHARCKACNISFGVDFSRAIELAFRASPEIRDVDTQTFCIGGPGHFPHVVAQVRLGPGERFALPLSLTPGYYVIRSAQLARSHEARVTSAGGVRRVDLTLGEPSEMALLTAGDQLFTLVNPGDREVVVRVERAGDRAYALTASRVMACAAFRELFPDQALAPGRLMAVTQATLVVAHIDDATRLFEHLGDARAFPVAARFYEIVARLAKEHGGSLIKTFGGIAIAGFERPGPAVELALALQAIVDDDLITRGLRCKIGVHRGPMMALTQAGRLDYFGQNVEQALAVAASTPAESVGLSEDVCTDIGVAERVAALPEPHEMQTLAGSWVMHVRSRRSAEKTVAL